jgi:hypothetical protein
MRNIENFVLYNSITPKAITSSTDATPIVVTATTHGFSNGDVVLIYGHTTNVAANGTWKVANKTANTFELTNPYTGANIAGSGSGAGSGGIATPTPKVLTPEGYNTCMVSVDTSGSATVTLKVAGSNGNPTTSSTSNSTQPNFGATQSTSNQYTFLQSINTMDASTVDGDTGIVVAGTDFHKMYEVNVNGISYITVIPTSWTAGAITVKLTLIKSFTGF